MRATVENSIATFRGWLLKKGYAEATLRAYLPHIRAGASDPLTYLRGLASWQMWGHARHAWRLYCESTRREEFIPEIMAVPSPRRPPAKPIVLPDPDTWRAVGPRSLQEHPNALGAVLWIVYYSGLRVGDVVTITYQQAQEACQTGRAIIRQKGAGGHRMRRWRAADWIRPYLAYLLRYPPWRAVWCLLSPNPNAAVAAVEKATPDPWHPHTFRHATLTYLNVLGVPIRTIMEISGHTSLASLTRYLSWVPDSHVDAALDQLGAFLFGPPGGGGLPDPGRARR